MNLLASLRFHFCIYPAFDNVLAYDCTPVCMIYTVLQFLFFFLLIRYALLSVHENSASTRSNFNYE